MSEFQLTFEEEGHRYTLDGRQVPSVTQILKPLDCFENVPPDLLERARELGSHVHLACHLDNRGDLDEESLDQEIWPYLTQYRRFRADCGWKLFASELRVAHPKLRYAGSLDDLYYIEQRSRWAVLDIKTGIKPLSVGPQTAAYLEALRHMPSWTQLPKMVERYCLELRPEKYRLHKLDDPSDWNLFLSCLNVFLAVEKRRGQA